MSVILWLFDVFGATGIILTVIAAFAVLALFKFFIQKN